MSPRQQNISVYVPSNIDKGNYVFVCDDSVQEPLQASYKGPFRILSNTSKTFKIDIHGRSEIMSIDRLEKAFYKHQTPVNRLLPPFRSPLEPNLQKHTPSSSLPQPATREPHVTRSGCRVHWPKTKAKKNCLSLIFPFSAYFIIVEI